MIFLLAQPSVYLHLSLTLCCRWSCCLLQCHTLFHQAHKLGHLIQLTKLRRLRNEILIFERFERVLILELGDEELQEIILAKFLWPGRWGRGCGRRRIGERSDVDHNSVLSLIKNDIREHLAMQIGSTHVTDDDYAVLDLGLVSCGFVTPAAAGPTFHHFVETADPAMRPADPLD